MQIAQGGFLRFYEKSLTYLFLLLKIIHIHSNTFKYFFII